MGSLLMDDSACQCRVGPPQAIVLWFYGPTILMGEYRRLTGRDKKREDIQ